MSAEHQQCADYKHMACEFLRLNFLRRPRRDKPVTIHCTG
jgi:hypothetical protein